VPEAQGEQRQDGKTEGEELQAEEGAQRGEGEGQGDGEGEGPQYTSLEDYFAKANVNFDDIRSLPVTVKIDGQTKAVPFADVLKSYQLEGHVNNKSQALSEQQRQFEAERIAAQGFVQTQIQQAHSLGKLAAEQLLSEYNRIDWNGLRQADPGMWAAKQQEFGQRQAAINNHIAQAQQLYTQSQQQAEQTLMQQRLANLPAEQEKLISYRSEWADPTKFEADRTKAVQAGRSLGFTDAEITQWANWDSRFLIAMDKIARFDALQAAAPEAAKRVRAAPPMAKPGTRAIRSPAQANRQAVRERFQANPRDEEAAAAMFDQFI
jgi:hypothetical protein